MALVQLLAAVGIKGSDIVLWPLGVDDPEDVVGECLPRRVRRRGDALLGLLALDEDQNGDGSAAYLLTVRVRGCWVCRVPAGRNVLCVVAADDNIKEIDRPRARIARGCCTFLRANPRCLVGVHTPSSLLRLPCIHHTSSNDQYVEYSRSVACRTPLAEIDRLRNNSTNVTCRVAPRLIIPHVMICWFRLSFLSLLQFLLQNFGLKSFGASGRSSLLHFCILFRCLMRRESQSTLCIYILM